DHVDAALAAGANDYITKPVNGKLLVTRLCSMIQASAHRYQTTHLQNTINMLEDLREAARVQQSQLPSVPFRYQDWRITGAVAPSGAIGGDLFDIVTSDNGCFTFLLDVSGHGTGSALVAAETRSELHHLLRRGSLKSAVETLNAHLSQRATGKYCCLAGVHLLGNDVEIINCGLPPVAILRGGRIHQQVWGSGLPVGMFEESSYEVTPLSLQRGDRIVLLSDGLTEPFGATDDAQSAVERLALWPTVSDQLPSGEALSSRIRTITRESAPELRDDATAVILMLAGTVSEQLKYSARPESVPPAVRWVVVQRPDWADPHAIDHGLTEALTNAILHGALDLASNMRDEVSSADADGYQRYLELAAELPQRPGFTDRQVELQVASNADAFGIRIAWDGSPCPPEARRAVISDLTTTDSQVASKPVLRTSGMGMHIIHALFDRVVWDDDGKGMELWLDRPDESSQSTAG
ncbi:MAG TPA: SpoIIE family protein phosphatase, partial [Polyangiaceae bacterium]|nr:SpoIIE family protein phosphatase [Polyangiaceae bacterium]